jgi:transcriptional regulator with XRE-family HTH domain
MAKGKLPVDKEEFLIKVGERMKEIRKSKGWENQEKFAWEKEVGRSQYGKYERGEDMRLTSLNKVITALDVTVFEFFNDPRFK